MRLKLAGALVAALLIFGMVFGVGQAAAASLPGGPLYGLKLTAEEARMGLTSNPEAKAELAAEFAENRLDEIGRMMAAGKAVDGETAHKAQQEVSQAYQYMNQIEGEGQGEVAQQLGTMLQAQHRVMSEEIKGEPRQQQEPVRTLLRSMQMVQVRVNEEGQGSQNRNQVGEPAQPEPPNQGGQSGAGQQPGQQDDGLLDGAGETGQGGQGQDTMGPSDGDNPGQGPAGQQNGGEVDPGQNQYWIHDNRYNKDRAYKQPHHGRTIAGGDSPLVVQFIKSPGAQRGCEEEERTVDEELRHFPRRAPETDDRSPNNGLEQGKEDSQKEPFQ